MQKPVLTQFHGKAEKENKLYVYEFLELIFKWQYFYFDNMN